MDKHMTLVSGVGLVTFPCAQSWICFFELLLDHYGARYRGIVHIALIWQQILARGALEPGHAENGKPCRLPFRLQICLRSFPHAIALKKSLNSSQT